MTSISEPVRKPDEAGTRPAKAPEAFRTISEVAGDLNIPQHVLRFWETRFSQIRPMKRGGGRRFYRPVDVDLLKGIRHLLYAQGYTIRGVQRILKEQGTAHLVELGRAAADSAETAPAADDGRPMPNAPRRPRIVAGADTDKPQVLGSSQAPRLAMSKEQITGLREALADLLWARRILSGSGRTH
jgi:DNA-binding transcriptional MerR regulator